MSTILVLGATSDIGFAIAVKFASQGYNVQLAARIPEHLQAMKSDLEIRFGINCTTHRFDVTAFETHKTFYESLTGKPDVVACVVGYMKNNEEVIASSSETERTMFTNFNGPVSILNIVAQHFMDRKKGTIIGISSVAGLRGRQSNYIYGSAKAGFTAYLSGLRNRLYRENVHVLTVLPGFVNTKMTADLNLPKLLTAQPNDVADAVYRGTEKKANVIYVKWFWRWIMLIITSIPESIFKKKEL